MVLKKGKFGIATGATVRSGHNLHKIRNNAKSRNLVCRSSVPPHNNTANVNLRQKLPVDQNEEKRLFTEKISILIDDGMPCNPCTYNLNHNVEFSSNKRKGWLLEKKIAKVIRECREESQLYNADNLSQLSTEVLPRIRLQVIATDIARYSCNSTRCHCAAFFDSSLDNFHPVGKHKYSWATDLLHKSKPVVSTKKESLLKQARRKQRLNQHKNKFSRGVQRTACITQKLRSATWYPDTG